MIRSTSTLLAVLLVTGCDRPSPAPPPEANAAGQGFDNSAAAQSIMQPRVIAEVEPTPTPTPPTPPPTGATVAFERGAALDDAGRAVIDRLIAAAEPPPTARWVVRGSSDSPGDDAANLAVSRRRALAVRDYLVGKGVAHDRIAVIALGERRPVAPNAHLDGSDDPAGRARNRRVDIEIVPAEAPTTSPTASPTDTATPTAG